ncbi:MAG: formyltransferase [Burkholderiaceae bacterium]
MTSAVVFAYHNVGVRCFLTLLARGVEVRLVVTHRDNPNETIWFESVRDTAIAHAIPVITPDDASDPALFSAVERARPEFIFSFYYRHMLPTPLLALAARGAYNMHGSLLPKYRGRVPINWAIIHGETETGATLHEMASKPDAGAIVAQTSVPILPDDTAHEVFIKVTVAAEQSLWRVLPDLMAGRAPHLDNDLAKGSYFGGRKPGDGRIDWHASAATIHDLVRAVAPPYPGATTTLGGHEAIVERTRHIDPLFHRAAKSDALVVADGRCIAICGDGLPLEITRARIADRPCDGAQLAAFLGAGEHALGERP